MHVQNHLSSKVLGKILCEFDRNKEIGNKYAGVIENVLKSGFKNLKIKR